MRRAIVWFRRDLTLDDNPAWTAATQGFDEVIPIWVSERPLLSAAGPFRREFALSCVRGLDAELAAVGGALSILEGPAARAVPAAAAREGATSVFWNADVTTYAQSRDREVAATLGRLGVRAERSWGTLVHPPGSILTAAGTVPRVFSRFYVRWAALRVEPESRPGAARVARVPGDAALPESAAVLDEGHRAALGRLDKFLGVVDDYAVSRDRPDLDATSKLSADLRFGTISPRRVVRNVGAHTASREAFVRQLAWRDWYAHLFFEHPELATRSQQAAYDRVTWRNEPVEVEAWRQGRTGYPIVDAAMRELAASGWLHNRLRMVVASFLVKDLLVDWRIGERHFRRLLVDGDVPQNAGNWQWSAGTGPDAAPYFRVMNPVAQGRKFDPAGDYVRTWLPELAGIRDGSVHAPWELGPLELAAAGVRLGESYPFRLVEHAVARERVLRAYAAARAAGRADPPDPGHRGAAH